MNEASPSARAGAPTAHLKRSLLGAGALALLLVACGANGGTGPGWTFAPPGPTPQATEPASPEPTDGGEPGDNVIGLEMTADLRYAQQGQVVEQLELVVGEEYTFEVDNVAGFSHDIFLGPPDRLAAGDTEGLPGIPAWESGVREFSWTATDEAQGWEYGCTVPGHYQAGMRGELVLGSE